MNVVGTHLMLELNDCNREHLDDLPYVKDAMNRAASEVGAHILGESFHRFHPQGVTGILAIAESHMCIPYMAGAWIRSGGHLHMWHLFRTS